MALVASACVGGAAFFGWLAFSERRGRVPSFAVKGALRRRRFRPRLVR